MNLAVFLSLGESFSDLKKSGQDQLMIQQNIKSFAKAFDHVYVFTYKKEKVKLPANCQLITPPLKLHRYVYALVLPFIHYKIIIKCHLLRCFQLSGTLPAIIAKVFINKKFVFNLGYDYYHFAKIENKPLQAMLYKVLQPLSTRLASAVIVKYKTQNTKFFYIPNGVNTKMFKPKHHALNKIPKILFIGRLEPQKNILSLIKAISQLKIKTRLTIIGSGSLKSQISKLARSLNVNLKIINQVPHSKLPPYYQKADIFVLPSLIEGSPKVLLEAMACNLPCIASNIPQHKQIICQNTHGLLSKTDLHSISQALKNLLKSNIIRKKLGKNARQRIIEKYNIKHIMEQEIKILQTSI